MPVGLGVAHDFFLFCIPAQLAAGIASGRWRKAHALDKRAACDLVASVVFICVLPGALPARLSSG
jgi:hypothetical protein